MTLRFCTLLALLFLTVPCIPAAAKTKAAKQHDVCDTIAANVILSKFALMVQAADLGTFLSSRGPFTVFAPTDSAFSRLPPGEFDALLRPENKERLQLIVLFHVVNGKRLTFKDLLLLKTTLSCQGSPLTFRMSKSGTQFVMKSKIVATDIRCQNGNIAEIDTMLTPPDSVLPALAAGPVSTPVSATNPAVILPLDTNAASPVLPAATNAATQ